MCGLKVAKFLLNVYNIAMKKFKYKFSKLIMVLIYVGMALCVVGFALNLYVAITKGISSAANPFYPILQYTLMFFITIVLFVILLSIAISSYYSIDDKNFVTSFGLIKSKYAISEIDVITLDRKTNKLSVTFLNGNYIIIVVNEEWYNQFIESLIAVNPKIEYAINSEENKKDN
jgi:hypothetical protein